MPVALVFNGISHAVMMATPQDLEDFALGFALSEGIIDNPGECRGIEVKQHGAGTPEAACVAEIDIAPRHFERLKLQRRTLAGRTGCGLCGVESLQALDLRAAAPMGAELVLIAQVVVAALDCGAADLQCFRQ